MPKQISKKELDAIVTVVTAQAEGVQVSAILKGLSSGLEKRTLQRRLALLVEQKRLIAEGMDRAVAVVHLSPSPAAQEMR